MISLRYLEMKEEKQLTKEEVRGIEKNIRGKVKETFREFDEAKRRVYVMAKRYVLD